MSDMNPVAPVEPAVVAPEVSTSEAPVTPETVVTPEAPASEEPVAPVAAE